MSGATAGSAGGDGCSPWWFATGAILASAAWFTALGLVTRLMAPLLKRARAEPILDGFVAATMGFAALRLLLGS